ncbi:MAG: T9SS type A sorting domain-containing protein, partial [Bacteroidota bacterium]
SSGQFRPANIATVKILAGDLSNQYNLHCASGISGTVSVIINGPAYYINAIPGALTPIVNGDTLIYSIPDFGTVNFNSDFSFVVHTDTTAQIGQQVCFDVSVTPTAGDNNPSNNFYSHCFNVANSYDPNDKEVSPVGAIDSTQEWLTYTIRFQNTGTAPAQHIYILDTLDNDVDESSIQLLAYSHEPIVQVIGNVVRFNFPNINLPDSTNDEPASHGYIQYKVKPNRNLPAGTQINNTAYIYFDFNTPVVTNTASNTVDAVSSVAEHHQKNNSISIYPNPVASGSVLHIASSEIIGKADILFFDMMGRAVYTTTINTSSLKTEIQIPQLQPGIYQCVVNSNSTNYIQKIIIQNKEN